MDSNCLPHWPGEIRDLVKVICYIRDSLSGRLLCYLHTLVFGCILVEAFLEILFLDEPANMAWWKDPD
jgi:hypothetical protein